jgi:hypothetical protein
MISSWWMSLVRKKRFFAEFILEQSEGLRMTEGGGTEDGGRGMSNHRTRANRNYVNPFVVFRCGIRKARTRFTYKNISCD